MWSNNEDGMSLFNKPSGVIGLYALSDKIVSAEFPDDNEELFYANKFIDLNEDTDPDMGLNFQARQA